MCQTVDLHGAGIWHQDQLRALQHQDPGALGELPVIADHSPNLHRAAGCVQAGDIKIFTGGQVPLHVKITGVDLRVVQPPSPEAVKQDQGVAGAALMPLQQSHADGHAQRFGKPLKCLDKGAVSGDGLSGPLLDRPAVNTVSIAPHFGEQGNIGAQRLGLFAGFHSLFQIALQRAARGNLQQGDL